MAKQVTLKTYQKKREINKLIENNQPSKNVHLKKKKIDDQLVHKNSTNTKTNSATKNKPLKSKSPINNLQLGIYGFGDKTNSSTDNTLVIPSSVLPVLNKFQDHLIKEFNVVMDKNKENLINLMDQKTKPLKDEISNLRNEIKEILDKRKKPDKSFLFDGGCIEISSIRLELALRFSSHTEFVSKIFTALVDVEDVYMRNLKGGKSKTNLNSRRKQALDPQFVNELYLAVDSIFGNEFKKKMRSEKKKSNDQNVEKKFAKKIKNEINVVINNKLSKINKHFENLKNGLIDKNLSKEDKCEFKDYEKYSKDTKLFDQLEDKLTGDEHLDNDETINTDNELDDETSSGDKSIVNSGKKDLNKTYNDDSSTDESVDDDYEESESEID